MTMNELGALLQGLAPAIRDYVHASQKALVERLSALEAREPIVGRDGARGPAGENGRDGRDGTLENLKVVPHEDGRGFDLRYKDSDRTVEGGVLRYPVVLDRGVYKSGTHYDAGDGVTWGGSWWIAQAPVENVKPGDGATAWRLAVKAGRDGKPGRDGERGPEGKSGAPGRDLTQVDAEGRKW